MPPQQVGQATGVSEVPVYYVPPPDEPTNAFAAFWSAFYQTRNPWAMEVFKRRLDAMDPLTKAKLMLQERELQNAAMAQRVALAQEKGKDSRAMLTALTALTGQQAQIEIENLRANVKQHARFELDRQAAREDLKTINTRIRQIQQVMADPHSGLTYEQRVEQATALANEVKGIISSFVGDEGQQAALRSETGHALDVVIGGTDQKLAQSLKAHVGATDPIEFQRLGAKDVNVPKAFGALQKMSDELGLESPLDLGGSSKQRTSGSLTPGATRGGQDVGGQGQGAGQESVADQFDPTDSPLFTGSDVFGRPLHTKETKPLERKRLLLSDLQRLQPETQGLLTGALGESRDALFPALRTQQEMTRDVLPQADLSEFLPDREPLEVRLPKPAAPGEVAEKVANAASASIKGGDPFDALLPRRGARRQVPAPEHQFDPMTPAPAAPPAAPVVDPLDEFLQTQKALDVHEPAPETVIQKSPSGDITTNPTDDEVLQRYLQIRQQRRELAEEEEARRRRNEKLKMLGVPATGF